MQIPSEADWRSEPWDLDIPYAYKHFFGKDRVQAAGLFVENALCYQEDVMFMPATCFYFYAHAYIDYLMSEQSEGDSDGASCFFGLVEVRADDILRGPGELRERIRALLRRLGERQTWYDATPHIYGDFRRKAEACLKRIEEPNKTSPPYQ